MGQISGESPGSQHSRGVGTGVPQQWMQRPQPFPLAAEMPLQPMAAHTATKNTHTKPGLAQEGQDGTTLGELSYGKTNK